MRLAHLIFCLCIPFASTSSQQDKLVPLAGGTDRPSRPTGSPPYSVLNINNFASWARAYGPGGPSAKGNHQGYYPRGTGNVIFTDGIIWGAKVFTDRNLSTPAPRQLIRVGGTLYRFGLSAGWVDGFGANATAVSPSRPNARIYRIRRDYKTGLSWEELRQDAAELNEIPISSVTYAQIDAIMSQYDIDWNNWPVDRGAPYIERNGIPGYQPPPPFSWNFFTPESLITGHYDEPGLAGVNANAPADQVVWAVANDLDLNTTLAFQRSEPLGLEVQFTTWGYKTSGALGHMLFKRIKIINKGGVDTSNSSTPMKGSFWLDSVFTSIWSDGDLGSGTDDLAGCDTSLQLGFYYNGNSNDRVFETFSIPPPSVGYALLQGPVVPGAPSDSATIGFASVRGKKNLPLSSYWQHSTGDVNYEPCAGGAPDYSCTYQWWKFLTLPGFPFSGDPVTGTGSLDGLGTNLSMPPGDRRFALNTGPFTLAPGDTQELVIAVVGGIHADRFSSIGVMKYNARFAQQFQRRHFDPPRAPFSPIVRAIELDQQIILEWGTNSQMVGKIEGDIIWNEFRFEGYNVYQFSKTATNSGATFFNKSKKIATFDIKNGVKKIYNLQLDGLTGSTAPVLIQSGHDIGVQRYVRIRSNFLEDSGGNTPLYNGREYFFAVTAYNYSPFVDAVQRTFESEPQVLSVRPRIPFGIESPVMHGDILKVSHISGSSNGTISPYVIDPLSGTGDSYQVRFDTTGGQLTWFVTNTTKNRLVISGQANQTGDEDYPILEGGVLLKVIDGPSGSQPNTVNDVFSYTSSAAKTGPDVIKASASHVGVYPNPYYGAQSQEVTTWRHFVTFNNLPPKVKIQIYNIGGQLVRTLEKNDPSQFLEWDLTNQYNWQVASGIYICYVEMPDIGETKVLKLAVIQQQLMPTH